MTDLSGYRNVGKLFPHQSVGCPKLFSNWRYESLKLRHRLCYCSFLLLHWFRKRQARESLPKRVRLFWTPAYFRGEEDDLEMSNHLSSDDATIGVNNMSCFSFRPAYSSVYYEVRKTNYISFSSKCLVNSRCVFRTILTVNSKLTNKNGFSYTFACVFKQTLTLNVQNKVLCNSGMISA